MIQFPLKAVEQHPARQSRAWRTLAALVLAAGCSACNIHPQVPQMDSEYEEAPINNEERREETALPDYTESMPGLDQDVEY